MRIGIISDTHGFLDPKVFSYFSNCDQVWHAGDIGTLEVTDKLREKFDLKAVYGNIDGGVLRQEFPEDLLFEVEDKKILITHIAGTPNKYNSRVKTLIELHKPHILVCGHSHILRVEYDKKFNLLYLNPGAAGVHGFHKVRTLLRFEINGSALTNMQAIELGPRTIKLS